MKSINPYLIFDGNCEAAFNFYKEVFGSKEMFISKFSEIPGDEGKKVSEADKDKVMHVSIPMGNTILMGSDAGEGYSGKINSGNNFSISIDTDSKEEADRFFKGLSEGGVVLMNMNDTFWGAYFGMVTDKFGINWMVSYSTQH
ncbi:MAG TPA: VOC family protein [Bacteroidetes bacterium]|nr:VOC family protein [Ignavibacteria bacterium]HCA41630.1 VOC family protein [Bacteroidota bacterium]HCN37376.1 VOC family protein [Bacteroidota bacterium]